MQVKDIINAINIFNVKIVFDRPEEVAEKIMSGSSLLYFTPVEGKDLRISRIIKILPVQRHQFISLIYL